MVREEELKNPDQRIPALLRQKIVSYTLVYTLTALLVVAFISIFPLFRQLKAADENSLFVTARIRAVAIGEYLGHVTDIARQITSRSSIRDRLSAFEQGMGSLAELEQYTRPKLEDALRSSEETLGITRLNTAGQVVARTGISIPLDPSFFPSAGSRQVAVNDPTVLDGSLVLVIGAPILDGDSARLGTDLIAFATDRLQKIVQAPDGLGKTGVALLGKPAGDQGIIFFPGRNGKEEGYNRLPESPDLIRALQLAGRGESGHLQPHANGGKPFLVYSPVPDTPWGLLVQMDRRELFSQVNREVWSVALVALLLTLCGGVGIFFLLRPLTDRVVAYSNSMANLNKALQQEITDRTLAEEGLRRSEQEWAQTFESITDAVAIIDRNGKVFKMNRAAATYQQATAPLVTDAQTCRVFSGLDRHEGLCPFDRLLQTKRPEHCELHEAATNRDFLVSVYPMLDDLGEVRGAVHIAQDITEQKTMERLKDEMVSSVSHEMRTPLTAMLGFLEFMLENEVPPEQQRDYLQTVYGETQRLADLISSFLHLQRLQADLETYHMEPLAVDTLFQESARLFAVPSSKHTLEVECPANLPSVRGDARRLGQILKNLINNAIRYSPQGGTITLGAREEKGEITIWVKDEGIGIPPEDLEKIFSRFYRVDDSDRRIPGGIGLGLALVREMVRAHGGRVWAESTLGQGSTFYFTLPIAERS